MDASDAAAIYCDKLLSADDAVAPIADGSLFIFGAALAEPQAVLWALANRLRAGELKRLRIMSGPPMACALDSVLALGLADCVERISTFVGEGDRGLVSVGLDQYLPNHFHQLPRLIEEGPPVDVAATVVSPMDGDGYFSFGTNNDSISTALRCAKRPIVEVNSFMPRVHGDSRLHVSAVAAVVENHSPFPDFARGVPEPNDEIIARSVAAMIADGDTIQLGVGGLPMAVCAFLAERRDLGIHTEFLSAAMVDLVTQGVATGARKSLHPGKHVFTVAAGDRAMLDVLHDNPAFESYPVSYTNHQAVIARNDNLVSVNSVLEVDLLGQANAEFLAGHQFSGSGGQLDYVRGAYDARHGKSILVHRRRDRVVHLGVPRRPSRRHTASEYS
ncbi:MAG: acetyl-CoA hydrolase/transferase C-terminal domain-containing protein, partial [bacterium]